MPETILVFYEKLGNDPFNGHDQAGNSGKAATNKFSEKIY